MERGDRVARLPSPKAKPKVEGAGVRETTPLAEARRAEDEGAGVRETVGEVGGQLLAIFPRRDPRESEAVLLAKTAQPSRRPPGPVNRRSGFACKDRPALPQTVRPCEIDCWRSRDLSIYPFLKKTAAKGRSIPTKMHRTARVSYILIHKRHRIHHGLVSIDILITEEDYRNR
jgi:hypothetical protein